MSFTRNHSGLPTAHAPVKPRFHIETVREESGAFRDQERVQLIIPGNPLNSPVKIVTDEHRQRWPAEYAAFKNNTTQTTTGYPIEHWPALSPAQVRMLKSLEIHSVEDCASLDDRAIQRIGLGGRGIKNAAIAYLDDAESMRVMVEISRQNELKDTQIATLTEQVKQLGEILERMQHEMKTRAEAPSAVDTFIPGVPGFTEQPAAPSQAPSALDEFYVPKRRGRPPKPRDDAEQARPA